MSRLFADLHALKAPQEGAGCLLSDLVPLMEGVVPLLRASGLRPGEEDLVWTTLEAASLFRRNQIISLTGADLGRVHLLRRLRIRRCLGRAFHVVADSDAARQAVLAAGVVSADRISVIPLMPDAAPIAPAQAYLALFGRLGASVALCERRAGTRPRRRAARIGLNPLPAE